LSDHIPNSDPCIPLKKLIGKTKINYRGIIIRIYNIERTLAEAYRIDLAGPDFYWALKRYIKMNNINADKLATYDKILKCRIIPHLQQELANE